ncbi:PREDICTED: uncharacterized protein LOC106817073, partial [Priapulus caudatus]|uniref:Uncharacterized protein LOC106817073 n=1 Tax=Priapulus caudatus TaxID=37621 RepID=A0ABM1EYD5_PRICU
MSIAWCCKLRAGPNSKRLVVVLVSTTTFLGILLLNSKSTPSDNDIDVGRSHSNYASPTSVVANASSSRTSSSVPTWQRLEQLYSHSSKLLDVDNSQIFTHDELFAPTRLTSADVDADGYVVPNIVHYVRFGRADVTFVEMLCMRSAWQNIRPKRLLVHCDFAPTGHWWDEVRR